MTPRPVKGPNSGTLRYGSVCSGIESATVAWHPLGWEPVFFSEIEPFPRAVLSHHYPKVPLHGDFTTIRADEYGPIDLLVGGTPCQSFSIAGLRGGLADDRGNLALEFLRLADRKRPRWLVWENVPGVLSSNGGRDFGSILGGMGELGYGYAYRILDAQYFGVPQRRRRVFVVAYLGDWRHPAAVLFERQSLSGNPAPRREAQESVASLTANGVGTCGADDNQGQAGQLIPEIVGQAMSAKWAKGTAGPAGDEHHNLVPCQPSGCRGANGGGHAAIVYPFQEVGTKHVVRRLTPRECERLQGFPDDYTRVLNRNKIAADGPRYKALGNSMAVPCMRWIGKRIALTDAIAAKAAA